MSSKEIEDKSSFEKNIDKPVKILHVAATTTGSIGLLLLYLAKHLDKKTFDVEDCGLWSGIYIGQRIL